jgi:GTPase involved in cell partitioning and DNA repair
MAKNPKLESQNEEVLEKFISNVDTQKVESIKNDLQNYKDSLRNKEYAVSMNSEILERFETYMKEEVQWRSKEALGVKEIVRRIDEVKREGIKDGVVYFTNLEVEASHYFVLKGQGIKEINSFVSLWKTFEETLALIQQDNLVIKDLEQQLAAAEQGIELE